MSRDRRHLNCPTRHRVDLESDCEIVWVESVAARGACCTAAAPLFYIHKCLIDEERYIDIETMFKMLYF
jgi:hypothetical protein